MPDNPTTDPVETDPEGQENQPADPPAGDNPPADDPDDLLPEQQRNLRRAQQQAAQYRTQLRETEGKVADLEGRFQALVQALNPEAGETDPAEALTAATTEAESLRTENATLRAELAVHSLAADNGGNPNALLDSRSFLNALQALDASADDYRDQVAQAIKDAVQSNANLTAAGPAPAKGGAPGAGQGSAGSGGVTQEQFDAMGLADRNELYRTDPDTYRRLAASIR